jgi:hypothetical protein
MQRQTDRQAETDRKVDRYGGTDTDTDTGTHTHILRARMKVIREKSGQYIRKYHEANHKYQNTTWKRDVNIKYA